MQSGTHVTPLIVTDVVDGAGGAGEVGLEAFCAVVMATSAGLPSGLLPAVVVLFPFWDLSLAPCGALGYTGFFPLGASQNSAP